MCKVNCKKQTGKTSSKQEGGEREGEEEGQVREVRGRGGEGECRD